MQGVPSFRSPRAGHFPMTVGQGPPVGYTYASAQQPQYYSPPQQQQHQQHVYQQPSYPVPMPMQRGYEDVQREEKQALTITSLQNQILAMSKELSNTSAELSHVSAENVMFSKSNAELHEKLETTRAALRETRDSLEQVQSVIKPLGQAQRLKDQQLQQLAGINRSLEARALESEAMLRQAEVTIQQHMKREEANEGDESLIEKLHEKLVASQDALVKTQNELQRLQVSSASTSSDLSDARRKISALEVQLLMQSQTHVQAMQVKKDEYSARENSLFVELASCRRRLVMLEEQVSLQTSLREASRIEDERERNQALSAEIRAAMGKIGASEEQQQQQRQRQLAAAAAAAAASTKAVAASKAAAIPPAPAPMYSSPTSSVSVPPTSSELSKGSFFSALTAGSKFLSAGRKPPVPQTVSPGKSSKPGGGSPVNGSISSSSSGNDGNGNQSSSQPEAEGSVGDDEEGSNEVLVMSPEARGEAVGSGSGSPDSSFDSSSDEVNMPIFFRPLSDITDEVARLEKDRERAVRAVKDWSESFVRTHKREPSAQDVAASPAIKGLYNEIAEIGLDLKKNEREMHKTMSQLSKLELS